MTRQLTSWSIVGLLGLCLFAASCDSKSKSGENSAASNDASPAVSSKGDAETAEAAQAPGDSETPKNSEMSESHLALEISRALDEEAKRLADSDVPEYLRELVKHIKVLNQLMNENMGDCEKGFKLLKRFMADHENEFSRLKEVITKERANLSPEEKLKVSRQASAFMRPILKESMLTQRKFVKACHKEARKLHRLMKKVNAK